MPWARPATGQDACKKRRPLPRQTILVSAAAWLHESGYKPEFCFMRVS